MCYPSSLIFGSLVPVRARPSAAYAWAMEYLRKGNVPTYRGNTFAKFAANWWGPGECLYLKEQEASGYKKSPKYINESRRKPVENGHRIIGDTVRRKLYAVD